jgi:acetamidase/formamidase
MTDATPTIPVDRWIIVRQREGFDPRFFHVDVQWLNDSIVGRFHAGGALVAAVSGRRLEGFWTYRDESVLRLTGQATADSINGTWRNLSSPDSGAWYARRVGTGHSPRLFPYAPTVYFTTYSSTHPIGLRIAPGDTVRMSTQVLGEGPGTVPPPIFIDGALPGDALAVRILSVRPASEGWSRRALELDWFTTAFARAAQTPAGAIWRWKLDSTAATARLDTTCAGCRGPAYLRLADLAIPLRPHLGRVAVAPQGLQAFDAADEGDYGGNLDYQALGAGATLYLPVFHPGALLMIAGDVHAAQGDGEIAGTGIETIADVEFTVDVIRGAALTRVRAEDERYLMAFGTSADLSEALRLANTNLAEWLERDFAVRQQELAMILGSALELDIANVWGAQATIVAKIRKDLISRLRPGRAGG